MAKKTRTRKATTRKPAARKAAAKKKPAARSASTRDAMAAFTGWITHTEFASTDPSALKKWSATVLGWKFKPSFPMPEGGEYLLFQYADKGGGGIRPVNPSEEASAVPYVQVKNVKAVFDKAIREGAVAMMAPERIMDDLVIAIVRAPGGVTIGLAGPK